jgi:hypothetical protein
LPLTRSEVDPFQVRAEVTIPLGAAVEENFGSAGGFRDCREAGARNPQAAHSRVAAHSWVAAHSRVAHRPPLANTYGHMDQDGSQAGIRAAQPLQAHSERNSH